MTDNPEPDYDYTKKERHKRYREKRRALGFVGHVVYVHEDDWPEIKAMVKAKFDQRIEQLKLADPERYENFLQKID